MTTPAMVLFGLTTAFLSGQFPGPSGGIFVALHLLVVCGLPAAIVLGRRGSEALAYAILLSLCITAIAAQPLVWLASFSTKVLLIEATILGAAVGVLSELLVKRPS